MYFGDFLGQLKRHVREEYHYSTELGQTHGIFTVSVLHYDNSTLSGIGILRATMSITPLLREELLQRFCQKNWMRHKWFMGCINLQDFLAERTVCKLALPFDWQDRIT